MSEVTEKSIFLQALDHESAEARDQFLAEACGSDDKLQASVRQLLNAHETADNPLDAPVAEWRPVDGDLLEDTLITETAITEDEGTIVDSYRLMEQIGEGGFGLVFVAQQTEPVRRTVALKILKPGMDTKEVVARFEAERQALAMMDHPNIAAVYDAGTTETGRPYFVMELVRGIAITKFCDQQNLDIQARLELFITVCQAVQHAHQKGIIHRDIKPSNVLVTSHDGKPVVKVIDFGVAKAIGQRLTDKTIYTRFTAMIGTPLYMSPEQAEMSGLDVDTRSDIYSLGVLLYELLTGTTPFDGNRMNSATYDELRRIIKEEEPPRPSDRLTTLGKLASTIETVRTGPAVKFPHLVRGDLDWIAMKAMEKDRRRRYESAGSLAADVKRYLSNDAIEARPPSQLYRLKKLARRNKVVLITASLVAMSLLLGIGISVWQAAKAISERNAKEVALRDAVQAENEATLAKRQIEEFADRLKQANILVTSGRAHADAGRLSPAFSDYTAAIEVQPNYYNAWLERASLQVQVGLWEPAAADFARALKLGVPPNNPANWGIAQLFLYTGDEENYRDYCKSMLELAKQNSATISIAEIRSYVMAQQPIVDTTELASQAEYLLSRASHPDRYGEERRPPRPGGFDNRISRGRPGGDRRGIDPPGQSAMGHLLGPPRGDDLRRSRRVDHPFGAVTYIAGLAHYRDGNFPKAIERFREALNDQGWFARNIVYPGFAMALHRNGQAEEAREAFARSAESISGWTDEMLNGPVGTMPFPWFDWIEVKLLHAEASVLLTGFMPADDPRMRQIEVRAAAAIRE
ncbi:serine/threonine protein kinase [Fuerstiella marisgermanici]|uniref:Serine/threonine-protein kinase PknB n=1 Tax=Fuerstiella marisgermanici TaxID=1891926 RepID=A0A1P8WS88_9PLAN|nr:serine/threonine-protein kinase [Fuerstiella marisgermanici]APZ96919.1 Serine/threonine-protein kinase PknB [Fuerstiella marisgermanici]